MNKKISQEKFDSSEDSNGEDSSFEEEDTFINRRIIELPSSRVNLTELKEKHMKYLNMNNIKTEDSTENENSFWFVLYKKLFKNLIGPSMNLREIQLRIMFINKSNENRISFKEKEQNLIEIKKFVDYYNKYEKVSPKKTHGKRKNIKNKFIDIIANFDDSKSFKTDFNHVKQTSFRETNIKNNNNLSTTRQSESFMLKSLKNANFHSSQYTINANPPNSNRESVISHDDKSSLNLRKRNSRKKIKITMDMINPRDYPKLDKNNDFDILYNMLNNKHVYESITKKYESNEISNKIFNKKDFIDFSNLEKIITLFSDLTLLERYKDKNLNRKLKNLDIKVNLFTEKILDITDKCTKIDYL